MKATDNCSTVTKIVINPNIYDSAPEYRLWVESILQLFKRCNTSVELHYNPDTGESWGEWLNLLEEEGYDMVVHGTAATEEKLRETRFTSFFYVEKVTLLSTNPKPIDVSLNCKIFSIDLGVCIFLVSLYLIISILLAIEKYIQLVHDEKRIKLSYQAKRRKRSNNFRYLISHMLWKLFPNIFLQESSLRIRRNLSRFIYALWLISVFFLSLAFLSDMQSDFPTEWDTIDSLEDVVAKKNLIPIFREGHYSTEYLKSSQEKDARGKVYDKAFNLNGSYTFLFEVEEVHTKSSEFVRMFLDPFDYNYDPIGMTFPFFTETEKMYFGKRAVLEAFMAIPISHRVSSNCAEILNAGSDSLFFDLEDAERLKFTGYWGPMFGSVLLRMRNLGLNLTLTIGADAFSEHFSDMENNKTDFTISFIPQQLEKSPLVEWGGATFFDDVHIMSGGPTGASYGPFLILKIFETNVWLSIMGYVIGASFMMGLSRYIYRSLSVRTSVTNEILNSSLIVFGLLFNQGTEWTPSVVSHRVLLSTCIFASTTIIFMATCNMFSFLSSADHPKYIDNLEDLLSQPKLRIFQHHWLLSSKLFKDSPRAMERATYEQAVRTEGIIESFDMIETILDELLDGEAVMNNRISVFLNFIPIMFDLLEEDIASKSFFHLSEEPMMTEWWGLVCRKRLSKPVKEQYYQSTLRYTEGGTFYRDSTIAKDYTYYLLQVGHEINIAPKQGMTMDNMFVPLIILASGILLALTQWRWPKWRKSRKVNP